MPPNKGKSDATARSALYPCSDRRLCDCDGRLCDPRVVWDFPNPHRRGVRMVARGILPCDRDPEPCVGGGATSFRGGGRKNRGPQSNCYRGCDLRSRDGAVGQWNHPHRASTLCVACRFWHRRDGVRSDPRCGWTGPQATKTAPCLWRLPQRQAVRGKCLARRWRNGC